MAPFTTLSPAKRSVSTPASECKSRATLQMRSGTAGSDCVGKRRSKRGKPLAASARMHGGRTCGYTECVSLGTVLIAPSEQLSALKALTQDDGNVLAFPDTDALR